METRYHQPRHMSARLGHLQPGHLWQKHDCFLQRALQRLQRRDQRRRSSCEGSRPSSCRNTQKSLWRTFVWSRSIRRATIPLFSSLSPLGSDQNWSGPNGSLGLNLGNGTQRAVAAKSHPISSLFVARLDIRSLGMSFPSENHKAVPSTNRIYF